MPGRWRTRFTGSDALIDQPDFALVGVVRVFFLVVLVGTTLAALTESSRQAFQIQRWRRRAHNHVVVVDTDPAALDFAARQGLVTVHGSATRSDVLRLAGTSHASAIVVATVGSPDADTLAAGDRVLYLRRTPD